MEPSTRCPRNRAGATSAALLAILALVGAAAVAGCRTDAPTEPEPPRVLVVEERALALADQTVPPKLVDEVARLHRGRPVQWRFDTIDSAQRGALDRVLRTHRPRIVIFLNEGLLDALERPTAGVSYLVPSEFPVTVLHELFEPLRRVHDVGFVVWSADASPKLLDHLQALSARPLRRVGGLFHSSLLAIHAEDGFVRAARARGLVPSVRRYDDVAEFAHALQLLHGSDALYIPISDGIVRHQREVADLVAATGLPAAYSRGDQVEAGGLVSTDAPVGEVYVQLARYVVLVLNGARASDLEIAEPTRLVTTVNLAAAARIGLRVPYELLVESTAIERQ